MRNIMKALNYQVKKDNCTIYAFLFALLFVFLVLPSMGDSVSFDTLTGSLFAASLGGMYPMLLMIVTVIVSTRICGYDYKDKTMNYEIMAGHSRKEVYWGRVIVAIMWCMGGGFLIMLLPNLFFTAVCGWGVSMDLGGTIVCYLLVLFPLFRMTCEFILLTFLLKNSDIAGVIGYVLFCVEVIIAMILHELLEVAFTVQFAATNMIRLLDFSNFSLGYVNGEDVAIYSNAIEGSLAAGTMGVSLVVGVVCLILGYAYFKKSDL